MTRTQPIEHVELTIGPAAVFYLAAALRKPQVQSGRIPSISAFHDGSRRQTRGRPRLYVVAAQGKTSH